MTAKRIKGFLHAHGKKVLEGNGEEIILTGWGLGNWLLAEGYMWQAGGISRFDRPRRIEQVLIELTGKDYAKRFWEVYRKNYIDQNDISYIAALGYNSVRIPMSWRLLMEEGEGIVWKDSGFLLLDRCLEYCENAGIYAFLDLHGAPGGQTGANIDDSLDDVPRLFIDSDSREKCLALWGKLAERYKDREIVGGYDLLNEPIAPSSSEEKNYDHLIPGLIDFYKEAIALIRKTDRNHLISVEGAHWATDLSIFEGKFDDNMLIHFHRYAEKPELKCLKPFLEKSEELNVPLWLGETGENINEWYAALYPLAVSLGIGYNLWPWKKMNCSNSPCSIRPPKDYNLILDYIRGGKHPGWHKAREIFDEYLENIRLENCELHTEVTSHVFRKIPFSLMAVDFDELPGAGISYSALRETDDTEAYRTGCAMKLIETEAVHEPKFAFDSQWERYGLLMNAGEYACYTFIGHGSFELIIELTDVSDSLLKIQTGNCSREISAAIGDKELKVELDSIEGAEAVVRIEVERGEVCLKKLLFQEIMNNC